MDRAVACVTTPPRWPALWLEPAAVSPCARALYVAYLIVAVLLIALCCTVCCSFCHCRYAVLRRSRAQAVVASAQPERRPTLIYEGFARPQ